MREKYIKFKRVIGSFPNEYELNLADDYTCEFMVNLENMIEKKGIELRAIRPNGTHNYCNLYISHSSWKFSQKIIKVHIAYDAKLSGRHYIEDTEILDTFWTKGRCMYKRTMSKEAFKDFVKFWLSDYLTNTWHDVYLEFNG